MFVVVSTVIVYTVAELSRSFVYQFDAYAQFMTSLPRGLRYMEDPVYTAFFCASGLYLVHRLRPRAMLEELGLIAPIGKAAAIGVVATCPMWIPSLLMGRFTTDIDWLYLLFGSLIWPLREEILYRGYVFGQLHRRGGWGLWAAAGISALVFGLVHLGNASVRNMELSGQIGTVAMLAGLSFLGAWIYVKWDYNLWVMVSLHGFMNLWWSVFDMAENPLGGWGANAMRLGTVALAMVITLNKSRFEGFLQRKPVPT